MCIRDRDWLKIVKTSQAKAKIRQFYKKELKDENIANGKQMLEYEAKRQATPLPSLLKPEYVEPILRKFSFADLDDLYACLLYTSRGGAPDSGSGVGASSVACTRIIGPHGGS